MTFLHQFSLLWFLAWAASAFFGLSVCWLIISSLWQLSRKKLVFSEKRSIPSKPGEPELYEIPAKKQTLIQIAKMMVLTGALLLAYEIGVQTKYSRDYAAWKARSEDYQRQMAAWTAQFQQEKANK